MRRLADCNVVCCSLLTALCTTLHMRSSSEEDGNFMRQLELVFLLSPLQEIPTNSLKSDFFGGRFHFPYFVLEARSNHSTSLLYAVPFLKIKTPLSYSPLVGVIVPHSLYLWHESAI